MAARTSNLLEKHKVCVSVSECVRMCVLVCAHKCVRVHVCLCSCVYVCMCAHISVFVCLCVCIHACMFAHVCAHAEDREVPVIAQSSLEGRYSSFHEDPSNVRCDSNNSPKALFPKTPLLRN